MKRLTHYLMKQCILACALFICSTQLPAQCPSGYSKFTLKWDYLDFLVYNSNYTAANGYLPNIAAAQTQNFAFGSSGRLTINHNYTQFAFAGENISHTGEAGSYGNSAGNATVESDVQFIGNGQVTLTFDTEVSNLQFSIYDVDQEMQANIVAVNASATSLPITITMLGATVDVLSGNNTTTPVVTSAGTGNVGSTKVTASFNVDIAGPVKQVTITMSGFNSGAGSDNGSWWLSDITACTAGSFPTNYYNVSQPYTGMPSYVLHSLDKTVYALDPATGKTKTLFTDAAVTGYINSMAYDPYNKYLYYVANGTASPGTNRAIKKYDFNTETISTIVADINTIGIPTSSAMGIEGGGAAYYNGSLYLALQTTNSNNTSGRESIIWRIDINGSTPYKASEVYALPTDDGAGLLHAWGDFVIKDGELFDSNSSGNTPSVVHFNMNTGLGTVYNPTFDPGQLGIDWAGNIYEIQADTATATLASPTVALYTEDGNIDVQHAIVSTPMYTPAIPNLGDAAEAFLPKVDFGDAPASYDAVSLNMAVHEKDANLRLGTSWGGRYAQLSPDPNDDGTGTPPGLDYFGTTTYNINANVYNNTGANATLVAWLDWNFDGVFQASEGRLVTVPSSASSQVVPLSWTMWVPYTANTNTWLRLRVTSASNGMGLSNVGGYFANGEVEDYPVVMGMLLAKNILSFNATANSKKAVDLNWQLNTAPNFVRTVVERSRNGIQFDSLAAVNAGSGIVVSYTSKDGNPYNSVSYYRLKLVFADGSVEYSDIQSVTLGGFENSLQINLNPANQYTTLKINSSIATVATIDLADNTGRLLLRRSAQVNAGENFVRLNDLGKYSSGIYYVYVKTTEFSAVEKLLIKRD